MRKNAFFYVQHLLGIGHLRRTATLANALAAQGFDVTLASGGFGVPGLPLHGVRFVQLPPAGATDATFKVLVDADRKPIDDRWRAIRRDCLIEAWRASEADLLVLELFPFGRRQMRFELIPLLETAACAPRRPMVVSSVRDVIGAGQKDPARQDEMLALVDQYVDRVLVHSDPSVVPFSKTFRHTERLAAKLHYSGYIVDDAGTGTGTTSAEEPRDDAPVIVSAGGGAVGMRLLQTAILARSHTTLKNRDWVILAGVNARASDLARLADSVRATPNVSVERSRADFMRLLATCAVAVNQGGYNTVMEIVQAAARSVVVPFAEDGETEQTVRARAFAARGLIDMVTEDELTPESLAAAIDRASVRPRTARGLVDLGGARRSAELLGDWAAGIEC